MPTDYDIAKGTNQFESLRKKDFKMQGNLNNTSTPNDCKNFVRIKTNDPKLSDKLDEMMVDSTKPYPFLLDGLFERFYPRPKDTDKDIFWRKSLFGVVWEIDLDELTMSKSDKKQHDVYVYTIRLISFQDPPVAFFQWMFSEYSAQNKILHIQLDFYSQSKKQVGTWTSKGDNLTYSTETLEADDVSCFEYYNEKFKIQSIEAETSTEQATNSPISEPKDKGK